MISFIIPEYIDGRGNCCRIREKDGETIIDGGINSGLRYIYKERCLDIKVIKRKCSVILNQRNLIPLYAGGGDILVPVKMRIPRVMRDGGYGYINAAEIYKINEKYIFLKDGSKICCFESKRVVEKRMKMARRLSEAFADSEVCASRLDTELKGPATKEDISILLGEIVKLKKSLERLV